MAEFKKLAAVDVTETANDAAKVLIEENGVIKRVPKDEVGGIKVAAAEVGQTIVVKAVDENGNPTEWEAADRVTSWNDLEDKPFDSKTHTVSNKSDLANAIIVGSAIKVSDLIIPKESMANTIITIDNQQTFPLSDILNDGAYEETDKYFSCQMFLMIYEDNFTMDGYTFPESGIYLPYGSDVPQVDLTWTETKPLDTKYLPEHLQFGLNETVLFEGNITTNQYGSYNFDSAINLIVDQEYTCIVDGVRYSGVCYYDDIESCVNLKNSDGQTIGWLYAYCISLSTDYFDASSSHNVKIPLQEIQKIDEIYLPDSVAMDEDVVSVQTAANNAQTTADSKMNKTDPVGTGSFSMNRKANTTVGNYSHAEGQDTTASSFGAHAEGYDTTASGNYSHAEGQDTTASNVGAHAEGIGTVASGRGSHAENAGTAKGEYSHAESGGTAIGTQSHAEGCSEASGSQSHAEGFRTIAASHYQHTQGKYNIEDATNTYAHIVGNGTNNTNRSNAHTLDWNGNAWYQGTVEGTAMIVKSSTEGSTKRFKITVDDSGTISATEIIE